jgi:hypothetical protein
MQRCPLVRKEVAAGQILNQGLVDRSAGNDEFLDVLGQGQLGERYLVSDASVAYVQ